MRHNSGRYSNYLRPFTYLLDLVTINLLVKLVLPIEFDLPYFYIFITLLWLISSLNIRFYEIYRFTKGLTILEKTIKQFFVFGVFCFSFTGFYFKNTQSFRIGNYVLFGFLIIIFFKFSIFYFLKKYRLFLGGNQRNVVVVGSFEKTKQLINFFKQNPDYGYRLVYNFDLDQEKKIKIETSLEFLKSSIKENLVDEIYCSLSDLSEKQLTNYIDFADNNLKTLKFIPDEKEYLIRNTKLDYYGLIPILSSRKIPLDDTLNKLIKRIFDIFFSIIVIVFILSWLIPLMAFLIKLESKGPVLFKQKRNGLNYKEFYCFKFRSMNINATADLKQVSKNDPRITKIGAIIRKTSIDELPQFFNVFFGDMSVVGPRPHMISETEKFAGKVDKFMVRHFIKPGITGMAQTNGYRGEVENDKDIINRVKYDIFYIENWSILLDIKIIFYTIFNAVKGEEKAY